MCNLTNGSYKIDDVYVKNNINYKCIEITRQEKYRYLNTLFKI